MTAVVFQLRYYSIEDLSKFYRQSREFKLARVIAGNDDIVNRFLCGLQKERYPLEKNNVSFKDNVNNN
jgi:hypothetical protein